MPPPGGQGGGAGTGPLRHRLGRARVHRRSAAVPAPARPRTRTALRGLQRLHRPSWRATGGLLPPARARRNGCDAGAVGVESAYREDLSSLAALGMTFIVRPEERRVG